MTSLTDVYEGDVGRVATRRQQVFGGALFLAGVTMMVGAIVSATTAIGVDAFGRFGARWVAGILAGLGLPAVVLGVFTVLPANRGTRATAVIGAGIAVLGVALFSHAYPQNWVTGAPLFALATTAVYFLGMATSFWCLFVALATFKTRSDPGGTATMEITEEGTIRLVEEARSIPGMGGVGLFGRGPDGNVETQTNRPGEPGASQGAASTGTSASAADTAGSPDRTSMADPTPTADGGSATVDGSQSAGGAPDADMAFDAAAAARGKPDTYCGNCEHFRYVRVDGELEPYCGLSEEIMEDMDACEDWTANDRR